MPGAARCMLVAPGSRGRIASNSGRTSAPPRSMVDAPGVGEPMAQDVDPGVTMADRKRTCERLVGAARRHRVALMAAVADGARL